MPPKSPHKATTVPSTAGNGLQATGAALFHSSSPSSSGVVAAHMHDWHSPLVRPLSSPKRRPLTNATPPRQPISGLFLSHGNERSVNNSTPPPVGTPVTIPPLSSVVVHGVGLSGTPVLPHQRNSRRGSPTRTPANEPATTTQPFLKSSSSMTSLSNARFVDDGHSSGYGTLHDWQHNARPGTAPSSLSVTGSNSSVKKHPQQQRSHHGHTASLSSSSSTLTTIITVHDEKDKDANANNGKSSVDDNGNNNTASATADNNSNINGNGNGARRVRNTSIRAAKKSIPRITTIDRNTNKNDEKHNDGHEKNGSSGKPKKLLSSSSLLSSAKKSSKPVVHSLSAAVNVAASISWRESYGTDLDITINDENDTNDESITTDGGKKKNSQKSSKQKKKDDTSGEPSTGVTKPRRLLFASSSLPSLPRRLASLGTNTPSTPTTPSTPAGFGQSLSIGHSNNMDGSAQSVMNILVDIPSLLQFPLLILTIISEYAIAPRYWLLMITPRHAAANDHRAYILDIPSLTTNTRTVTSSIVAKRFYRFHRFDGITPNVTIVGTRSNRQTITIPSSLPTNAHDIWTQPKTRVMDTVDPTAMTTSLYRLRAPPAVAKRRFMQLVSYDHDSIVTCHTRNRSGIDVGDDAMMTSFGHTIMMKPVANISTTQSLMVPSSSKSLLAYDTTREQYWQGVQGRAAANTPLGGIDDERTIGGCRRSVNGDSHLLVTCGGRYTDRYLITMMMYPELPTNDMDPYGYCYDRYGARWHNIPRPWTTGVQRNGLTSSISSIDIAVGHGSHVYCWATTDKTARGEQRSVCYTPPSPQSLRESNTGTQRIAWPWRIMPLPPSLAEIHARESATPDTSSESVTALASSLYYATRYQYGVSLPNLGVVLLFAGFTYDTHAQLAATCDRVCVYDPATDTYRILSWQLPLVIGGNPAPPAPPATANSNDAAATKPVSERAISSRVQISYVNGLLIMMGTEHVQIGSRWDGTKRIGLAPFVTRHIDHNVNVVAPIDIQTNCYILNLGAMCDTSRSSPSTSSSSATTAAAATSVAQLPERVALDHWHCIQRAIPDTIDAATSCVI